MTRRPSVSVIIATYNMARTLAESVESVRAQSFEDWEIVLVDDGSTDNTVELAEQFIRLEPRCRIVTQDHAGVEAARNTGIGVARGEWLLFLDGDDTIASTHLDLLLECGDFPPPCWGCSQRLGSRQGRSRTLRRRVRSIGR